MDFLVAQFNWDSKWQFFKSAMARRSPGQKNKCGRNGRKETLLIAVSKISH